MGESSAAVSRFALSTLTKARSFATHSIGFDTFAGAQDDEGDNLTATDPHPVILSARAGVEAENRPAKDLASRNGRDESARIERSG